MTVAGVDSQRPIFVVGTPRSGTTLTARILNRHPAIFMPGETHFFPDIYAQRAQLGELPSETAAENVWQRLITLYQRYNEPADQRRVETLLADTDKRQRLRASLSDYRSALTTLMELQAEFESKSRWGNNAPKDLFYVDNILAFYPNARFVVCVRDPRDFLKSYQGKWKVTAESEVDRLKQLYHPVVTTMLWKASMRRVESMRRRVPSAQLHELRYESLVSESERAVRGLCAFVGEPYYPDMLDVNFSNSSDQAAQGGIFSASVDSWKGRLSQEEVWIAQRLAGREMEAFGYKRVDVDSNVARLAALLLSTPWALLRALRANRANTGPIIPYLMRRLASLLVR